MKFTRTCLFLVSMTALVTGASASAFADTKDLAVSATISKACVITTSAVAFGTYDFTSAADNDHGVGGVVFNCTKGTAPTIQLSIGTNGSAPQRRMIASGNYLNYTLFSDPTRLAEWTTVASISGVDVGTVPVYGRIPAGQNQPAGSYTDTVVATITF